MQALVIIILALMFTFWTAMIDAEHILNKQYFKNHVSRFLQRCIFPLTIFVLNPIYGITIALIIFIFFDQILNKLTGKDLWYLGKTAKLDIFFSRRKWLYISLKAISLLLIISLLMIENINQ